MTHILMIEDDPLILGPVVRSLKSAGFQVSQATDGAAGAQLALEKELDLIILDILLPEMDGWEVCKAVRQHSTVPILMLTALSDEIDRILGLELGADDYLTKPFSTRELMARIKALLRRVEMDLQQARQVNSVRIRDIMLDLDTRQVTKNGVELPLRYKEFELLSLLMLRAGQAVSRAEIFDRVWGTDWLGDMRTLDVHIRWLREKLEEDPGNPELIQTVRGVGYRFTPS
ncbi:MAG TPA: response regulator transcription factor [Aggregatilinea sp.]|jgi:DNA-binding response OmpR family regulator|uniref:response regulator transcription factor n=1 Tax=Aggregatilinea sp. TaxID=2806333 RepID=UPI002CD13FCF|nr:response regulator transcription factor [Aggregatilinea sp.]HML21124.1 response regulator transcription factor [Aggregatilinea sp.]